MKLPAIPERVRKLQPYVCARHTCKGSGWIFLDANESPLSIALPPLSLNGINRYPDPTADELRAVIAGDFGVDREQLIMGNGTDELIDLAIRTFVRPGRGILSLAPTYGMYRVSADICGIPYRGIPLNGDFSVDEAALARELPDADVLFLCSPNNPTGNVIPFATLKRIVEAFDGLVFIDEAYGEFADAEGIPSAINLVRDGAKNLIVTRTFSKAFGAAGIRLGYGIADRDTIAELQKTKPPYNVSVLSQRVGLALWKKKEWLAGSVQLLREERARIRGELSRRNCTVYPSAANFILVRFPEALPSGKVYERLRREGKMIVRDFGVKPGLENCLRISIGTPRENDLLLGILSPMLP